MTTSLLLANLGLTLVLVGLIWTIQVVHYPLMGRVGRSEFEAYHAAHTARMTWLVAPLMCAELLAAVLLVMECPDDLVLEAWFCGGLVGVAWLSTALVQVPLHARLGRGQDYRALQMLVRTNWIRTIAWTLRAVILARIVWVST